MAAVARRVERWRTGGVFGQLLRFGVAGGVATLIYAAVYWPVATYAPRLFAVTRGAWPMVGNVLGYLAAMASGYFLHSRWSFRGHGERGNLKRTGGRFFAVSLVSFVMNSLYVWVLTGPWVRGPTWWPLLPIVFVTPLVTFALNRMWVFA